MGKTGKDFNMQNYNQWTWKIWIEDEGLKERIKLNWNQGNRGSNQNKNFDDDDID